MSTVPVIEQFKSWRSLKALRLSYQDYLSAMSRDPMALARYVDTGIVHDPSSMLPPVNALVPDLARPSPSRDTYLTTPLFVFGRMQAFGQQLRDVDGELSAEPWRSAVLAVELRSLLAFRHEILFEQEHGRRLGMMALADAAWLALAAAIGAMEVVDRWAPLLIEALGRRYVLAPEEQVVQHFMLRLWCAGSGATYPDCPFPRHEVTERILELWDAADPTELGAWLVQLCNLHTQLSRPKQFMDFVNDFSHVPVEILLLFRLRSLRGLPNPEVDHPLMRFPWSRLAPVMEAKPDPLLQGIYRRLEGDEGLSITALYQVAGMTKS